MNPNTPTTPTDLPATPTALISNLRELLAQGLCLCSSAHTDWAGLDRLLDRLEALEARQANRDALDDLMTWSDNTNNQSLDLALATDQGPQDPRTATSHLSVVAETPTSPEQPEPSEASIEPIRWVVIPTGIEATRFADPESFYLTIRRNTRRGNTTYIVSPMQDAVGFTRHGKHVYLRHDVNSKHAMHPTFEAASALACSLADGHLITEFYRFWKTADEQRFGPFPDTDSNPTQT